MSYESMSQHFSDSLVFTHIGEEHLTGQVDGYRFEARIVTSEDAPDSEFGDSRLTKLEITRTNDEIVAFRWDRGWEINWQDEATETLASFLAGDLVDRATEFYHDLKNQLSAKLRSQGFASTDECPDKIVVF